MSNRKINGFFAYVLLAVRCWFRNLKNFFMKWVRIGTYGMKKKRVNIQYKGLLMR
jgi:hypothetical protein